MPIYEFHCHKCDQDFETLVMRSDDVIRCPKCDSKKVRRLMSGFAHKSGDGKMTSSHGGCASCAGGSCATCH
jgi:putative FmdB family regulatory protein